MQQENLNTWEQFTDRINQLQTEGNQTAEKIEGGFSRLLFRGQGSDSWCLKTTLDRKGLGQLSLSGYYRIVSKMRPQIETQTNHQWELMEFPEFREWASKYDSLHLSQLPGYDYLVYLRHHGFPSPLLDWTRSAPIAAFFAFAQPCSDRVAVYVYQEYCGRGKTGSSDSPQIFTQGPYVRSHARHFNQKSEYTVAAQYKDNQWWYALHEDVFSQSPQEQDRRWKLTLPTSERSKVLRILDDHNLNEFSLFQTEEALLSTISMRELEF